MAAYHLSTITVSERKGSKEGAKEESGKEGRERVRGEKGLEYTAVRPRVVHG